ncbi:MAG: hypothetical protein ACHQQS_01525 [Thermoanaerobaculales bacterium]
MRWSRLLLVVVLATAIAATASAMFRAADLVVVPVAASLAGANNSNWHSDVEIRNVDTTNIDVEIVLLPCCGNDNRTWYNDITNALGGRTSDGFGHINASLMNIPPGRTVTITDIIAPNWGTADTKGALLFFAYEAGTLMTTNPPGGNPKNIVVTSRTYDINTDSTGKTSTYGQGIPGLPWYDYVDPSRRDKGYDHVTFTGIRQDPSFRTAVGYVNLSDRLTELAVRFTLKAADGTQLSEEVEDILPLAHDQWDNAANTLLTVPSTTPVVDASLTVTVDAYFSQAQDPTPAFMVYASRVDNTTNDPVYLEQVFDQPFPWDCIFNGNNCPIATTASALGFPRLAARPRHLLPPTRAKAR